MARASQTYLLSLNTAQFESMTRAIMLESNKIGKLQGLGQCLASWLRQWNDAQLPANFLPSTSTRRDKKATGQHQIYVALNPDSTQLLKAFRDEIARESGIQATISLAVMRLIDCSISEALEKPLA